MSDDVQTPDYPADDTSGTTDQVEVESNADLEAGDVLEIEADDAPATAGDAPDVPPLPETASQGADEVAPAAQGPIPEDERVIPPSVDPSLAPEVNLTTHIYVRASTNLPGWDLWAEETEEQKDEEGNVVVAAHRREGWIPNNEEGVRAIELGFAEIIEAPGGEEPPADDE